jgi:predicted tellurium resistance membrane protein TerC
MGGLSQDTIDGRDPEDEHLAEAQRRRARKVGALLVLVIVVIVATVFAWKISLQR